MNTKNLRKFVKALNDLPDGIKNNRVNMMSTSIPTCGTIGCHAGLVSMVANYIPELKKLYKDEKHNNYRWDCWADTLASFLGTFCARRILSPRHKLEDWAKDNPELWGNYYGVTMFSDGNAFGQDTNTFPHSVIIGWWTEVLTRVEEDEKQNKGVAK